MIISHSHKFIFIHIYKNAGSSIKHSLASYDYPSYERSGWKDKIRFKAGIYPSVFSKNFAGHVKAISLKNSLSNSVFNNYLKFAIVRNPYDWQVSLYNYALQNKTHFQHDLTKGFKHFEEYLDWRIDGNFDLQSSFVTDNESNLIIDRLLKFEQLQHDFKNLCKDLKIDPPLLAHRNSSSVMPFQQYYTSASLQKVADTFSADFELFNYSKDLV